MNPWSDPALNARLLELYAAGRLSHSGIAKQLNEEFGTHFTRDACLGRAHRLMLEPRERKEGGPPLKKRRIKPQRATVRAKSIERQPGVTFDRLRWCGCRYPYGAWDARAERFCGRPVVEGYSWCPKHFMRVFSERRGQEKREVI